MPSVQEAAKERIVAELKAKLGTELGIDKLHFQPFNSVELNGVFLNDRQNNKILKAEKLYASIDILPLLKNDIVISAIHLSNFSIDLSKKTKDSQLNIQFIIDAFKPSNDNKKTSFDIKINTLNINDGKFRFDVEDQPLRENLFDKNHIEISDFNASLALKSLKEDSLNIQIKRLSLKEKSGVEIKNLTSRFISNKKMLYVKGFKLQLPHSLVQFDRCNVDISDTQGFKRLDNAVFDCVITSSYITPKDISGFTVILKNFKDRIFLKARVNGSINDFSVSNLSLDYGDKMNLITNAQIKNVTHKDSLYLSGNVERLFVTSEGINGLIGNFSGKKQDLPKEITNLGNISFTGYISGYLNQLKAYGLLTSSLGSVQTDLLFGFDSNNAIESYFKGQVHTNDFDLGKLTNDKNLNKLSFDLAVDIKKPRNKKIGGKIDGLVSRFDYKNYSYKNISLNGQYDGLKIEGEAKVDDENVFLSVNGLFDLSQKQPILDFRAQLRNLRIDKLNLSDKYHNSYLSLNVNANFSGKNIDDAEGFLSIDSVRFYKDGNNLKMDKLTVTASGSEFDKKLDISSDIVNGQITGTYSFSTIINSFKRTFNSYLPALVSVDNIKNKDIKENNLTLDFTIGNTEKISQVLSLPFTIYSEAKITGFYNNLSDKFQLEVFFPSAKIAGAMVQSGYVLAENTESRIKTNITALIIGKNHIQNDVNINLDAGENTVNSQISFTNNSKQKFKGSFISSTVFSRNEDNNALNTDVNILPSNMILNDTVWQIEKSKISINSEFIAADNFKIHNNENNQYININGRYASKGNLLQQDSLKVDLKNINLNYVFNTLAIDALNFGGYATGSLHGMNMGGSPYVNINLNVKDFAFNNTQLGNLNLYSEFDDEHKRINLKGTILDNEKRKTDIDGYINPLSQELSINFEADKVNIGFLNKYASSLFNNVSGQGSGHVHLFGDFSNVTVEGKAFIENGSLGINFLNTTYSFTDTIYLKKDLIYFNNITFYDQQKNEAKISGKVVHDYFSHFMYYVELSGKNFMLYNATESLNPMFYGKVFATGNGSISGDEKVVNINAQLKTDKDSRIRMNFMEETVNEYSFITYRNKDSIKDNPEKAIPAFSNALKTESGMDVNMNFYVDATPDAVVEIIMDPIGGDVLRCSGSGALQFLWGTKTDPKLSGTYIINNGSYNFTFQKIIERKFSIQTGSTVLFRGNPFQANLDINAIYKLNANLNDLDSDLASRAGQATVPVECMLNITGELQHPNIGLDVALPSADAEVQRQVKSLMNNEDIVNRQMVYLLLLSKFYTPSNTNAENKSSDFASLASATLSTQISKILSRIDNRWQFGTNIRTSDTGFTNTEVELLLSSQLLNNRVLLNGNFGYREDPNTRAAFISDVDIEVLLNKTGTWRAKAYNHYNEKYYYVGSSIQTQGIGLMYRRDFDYLREIFGLTPIYKMQRDTVKHIFPDSTKKGSALGDFIKIK